MIISFILSFITGCIPSVFKIFQDYLDKKQELALTQLQIEASKFVIEEKYQEVAMDYDMKGLETRYATYNTGNKIVDAINGLVRPTFAYAILFNYIGITIACSVQSWGILTPKEFIDAIWGEADDHILGAVLGFYFSGRANEAIFNR